MTTRTPDGRHTRDGELVRYVDGELDTGRRAAVEAHVAACATCRRRQDELRSRSDALSALLAETDPPAGSQAPRSRPRALPPIWLRAAAAIALLGVVTASVEPVRAWVAAGWRAVTVLWADPAPEPTSAERIRAGLTVAFTPAGDDFVLEFAQRQRAGRARVHVDSARTVRARVEEGTGAEELLVLPSGLSVRNDPESAASYRITLPAALRRLEVRVGGANVATYDLDSAPPAGWRIDLDGPARRTPR